MAVLTKDNVISLLDTAGALTRPEGKCHAPAPAEDQHVIKVNKRFDLYNNKLLHEGNHFGEN